MSNSKDILEILDDTNIKSEFYLEEDVELKTIEVKRITKKFFKHIQVRSSAATVLLTCFGLIDAANLNQKTIDDALNKMIKDMTQEIKQAQQIIEDAGIATDIKVEGVLKGKLKITTPIGYQFLTLLKKWDQLNLNLTMLYMRQEIGNEELAKSKQQWVKRIRKFCRMVEGLAVTAYSATEALKKQSQPQKTTKKQTKAKPQTVVKKAV